MAHSITQHPPSALSFPSASRPSSLGFGFGGPARSPLASVSFGQWSPQPSFGGSVGVGANANANAASPSKPSLRPLFNSNRHASSPNLKRSRRSSSPTLSESSSPSTSPALGRRAAPLMDGRRKKTRQDVEIKQNSDVDVGMMLASLPPNAHLQIILNMIKADPSLSSSVLSHMPLPDIGSCVAELDRVVEKVTRQFDLARRELHWTRCASGVVEFCRLATSYISFFYNPPQVSVELHTLHTLLFTITRHILTLLRLAPPSVDSSETTLALSNLANIVLSKWSNWVDKLVTGVQQGEMYPHSSVSAWSDNLSHLVSTSPGDAQHVVAFVSNLAPTRERFVSDVGWLTGPRKW